MIVARPSEAGRSVTPPRDARWKLWRGLAALALLAGTARAASVVPLISFRDDVGGRVVPEGGARLDGTTGRRDGALRVAIAPGVQPSGVLLKAPSAAWDLSAMEYVAVDLENVGDAALIVSLQIQPDGPGPEHCRLHDACTLEPGRRETIQLSVIKRLDDDAPNRLTAMRGYPGGWFERWGLPAKRITHLRIEANAAAGGDGALEISHLRAGRDGPDWRTVGERDLLPLVDRFGQYRHKVWPGKTHSEEDLHAAGRRETADLSAHPGPKDWDPFGGWSGGPQLEATGHFRTQKLRGKCWLVDPDGRLFWSHGVDCVRDSTGATPVSDRREYFARLPARDGPFGRFYGQRGGAPHGYYQDKGRFQTYNFTGANLLRKYGERWEEQFADISHRRLRSWGLNTIANWSSPSIYLRRRTPYTATVNASARPIEGSTGYWGKFVDVFDEKFGRSLQAAMAAERGKTTADPWCIGYFVGNELSWGDELSLALAALSSPADQPAKRAFAAELRRKYGAIENLNRAWTTDHESWRALLQSRDAPARDAAKEDLAAFYKKTADRYFQLCRDAVKEFAPDKMYLGCRFAWANEPAIRAAATYCDVVSFNRYAYTVADFQLPQGVDKPVVIGEFHFGALDRGMLHTGLRPVASQAQRAKAYASYVRGALGNRRLVGTHWFTYGDQAVTGRFDGENYQIGMVDICDTPYPEIIAACRETGNRMYRLRWGDGEVE